MQQVACFDTAFHRQHPFVNDVFALPRSYYDEGVRRYGFHGLSYEYVTGRLREISPLHAAGRVVVAHLGNGASMCAIRDGHSVASSMGFTALDGLPMGTRCGQLDPGVVLYMMQQKHMDANAIRDLLYTQSGLKGLSGVSHDMRELEASDKPEARRRLNTSYFASGANWAASRPCWRGWMRSCSAAASASTPGMCASVSLRAWNGLASNWTASPTRQVRR